MEIIQTSNAVAAPHAAPISPTAPHVFAEPSFVALLTCPGCPAHPPLRFESTWDGYEDCRFVCVRCGRIYPIFEGVPDLHTDEWEDHPFSA